MDKDKNWEVTRDEFKAYWKKHFDQQDADKNGVLISSEYEPLVIFEYVDANKDGQIVPDEYQRIYVPHFDSRDLNKDDVLNRDEFWVDK